MNEQEITALAREYADENAKSIRDTFGLPERAYYTHRDEDEKSFESVIRFLLRSYALVEKSKVEEEYHEAKFTCGNVDPCSETFATSLAQKSVLERLFPEIAKEVEE